jgi:DNA (cytosine-5)-methyltransferase 1
MPTEHARAKGIPETVSSTLLEGLASSRAHRMLGNSVSWPVFHAVGQVIGDALQRIRSAAPQPPLRAPVQLDLLAA